MITMHLFRTCVSLVCLYCFNSYYMQKRSVSKITAEEKTKQTHYFFMS